MMSKAKRNLVIELHSRKGREKHGLCLVEGAKAVEAAGGLVEFTFSRGDTDDFDSLVTTQAPQDIAAVARVPEWRKDDLFARDAVVVLDGVQDPGNGGTILRLCQAFGASLLAVGSVDLTNPKAVRASAGAVFSAPWRRADAEEALRLIADAERAVYRLERRKDTEHITLDADGAAQLDRRAVFILGAEGTGIDLQADGVSISIPHDPSLESLNVGHAAAIALYAHATFGKR